MSLTRHCTQSSLNADSKVCQARPIVEVEAIKECTHAILPPKIKNEEHEGAIGSAVLLKTEEARKEIIMGRTCSYKIGRYCFVQLELAGGVKSHVS